MNFNCETLKLGSEIQVFKVGKFRFSFLFGDVSTGNLIQNEFESFSLHYRNFPEMLGSKSGGSV